jgi:uncharacterized protein YqeY
MKHLKLFEEFINEDHAKKGSVWVKTNGEKQMLSSRKGMVDALEGDTIKITKVTGDTYNAILTTNSGAFQGDQDSVILKDKDLVGWEMNEAMLNEATILGANYLTPLKKEIDSWKKEDAYAWLNQMYDQMYDHQQRNRDLDLRSTDQAIQAVTKYLEKTGLLKEAYDGSREVLLFDEVGTELEAFRSKLEKLIDKSTDNKWIIALKKTMSSLDRLENDLAKADDKLGVVPVAENVNEDFKDVSVKFKDALDNLPEKEFTRATVEDLIKKLKEKRPDSAMAYAEKAYGWLMKESEDETEIDEAIYLDKLHEFGLQDAANIKAADAAIKKAGLTVYKQTGGGITYFMFAAKKDLDKAVKAVEQVIDKSKEDEWS